MSTILTKVVSAFLALLMPALGGADAEPQQNSEKMVVLYTQQTVYYDDGTSESYQADNRYDEQGNLLGMDNYDGKGSRWENLYDENGLLTSRVYYDENGRKEATQYYSETGKLTKREGPENIGNGLAYMTTEYTYDSQDRLLGITATQDGKVKRYENYTYDDATHTGTVQGMSSYAYAGGPNWTGEITCDENWQVLTKRCVWEENQYTTEETYTYDEDGQILSYRMIDGNVYDEQYTYDETGNLLQVIRTCNGEAQWKDVNTIGTLSEALERQGSR